MEPHKRKDIAKMVATIIFLAFIGVAAFIFCACDNPKQEIAAESQRVEEHKGIYSLIHIGNGLYYDNETGIVYWWGGVLGYSQSATVPSAYYSSNGLLCKYDPETGHIEEISK